MKMNDQKNTAAYMPLMANDYISEIGTAIRVDCGLNGYGIYMILLQKLLSSSERKIKMDAINSLAFDIHCELGKLVEIITRFFDSDGEYFFSLELENRMIYFDNKYNKASLGGKKSSAMLNEEQRRERASKASQSRWTKDKDENTSPMLTLLASDANNRIKLKNIIKNGIEEKKIETVESSLDNGRNPDEVAITEPDAATPNYAIELENEKIETDGTDDISIGNSKFFNSQNTKVLWDLYNRNSDKYPKISFEQFDKLMLLSIFFRIKFDNQKVPDTNEELQLYTGMINLEDFQLMIEYCSTSNPEDKETIEWIIEKYQIKNL